MYEQISMFEPFYTTKINQYGKEMKIAYFNGQEFQLHRIDYECRIKNSIYYGEKIYKVIYEYWYGKIPKGLYIHHIDEEHNNNDINNLQILTLQEHMLIHNNPNSKSYKNNSKKNSGNNNAMYGRSAYDIWVEKYGIEEAEKRKQIQINKRKNTNKLNQLKLMNIIQAK
jgi:hypothetical protein